MAVRRSRTLDGSLPTEPTLKARLQLQVHKWALVLLRLGHLGLKGTVNSAVTSLQSGQR